MRLSFNELFAPRPVPVADDYLMTPEYLSAVARRHAAAYRAAKPFPHVVIDDFLPMGAVDKALAEFPGPDDPYWTSKSNAWRSSRTPGASIRSSCCRRSCAG